MGNEVQAVQRSQDFYRLKQVVESPGDIYELEASAMAMYIGPDSDIAEVQVTYMNPDEPDALEQAVVSVNGPLVGRIDSLPVTKVPTTGQGGRILVSPVDIVDNSYTPPASLAQRQVNVPAVIDFMIALRDLPSIPEVRADRTLRYAQVPYERGIVPGADNGSTDIIIPIYGRRMVTVQVVGNGVDVALYLVNLIPGGAPTVPRHLGTFAVPFTAPVTKQVRAGVIRASDAARQGINLDAAFNPTAYYTESDQPNNPNLGLAAVPVPRGMADLLLVNLHDNTGAVMPVGTFYADLFVKIADRET